VRRILSILVLLTAFVCSYAQSAYQKKAVQALLVDAVAQINAGHPQNALKLLNSLYEIDPKNDALSYYMGLCKYAMGDYPAAYELFKRASSLDPANNWYKEALASTCPSVGKNVEMLNIYEHLLEEQPNIYTTAYTLTMMGDKAMAERKDSLAMAKYEQALSCEPEYAPALLGMAEIYRMKRKFFDFFSVMNVFVRDRNVNPHAKTRYLENVLKYVDNPFYTVWHGQLDSLVAGTLQADPADSSALRFAGRWYYGTERKQEAKACFDKWVREYPTDVSARMVQMEFLLLENDYAGAKPLCDTLLTLTKNDKPRRLEIYSILGDILHQTGDEKAAFKAYDKALKIDPEYAPVLNNYAYFLCLNGTKLDKAAKMSRIAIEKQPENATFLDTYGWIMHLLGNDKEAKQWFKKAIIYGGNDNPVVLEHYADVLDALEEKDLANYYRRLAKSKKK